jgi:RNA polymerase sigma factor (sigma-70 family)
MDKQFDSMTTYISLAKKTINKFAPKFYNGLNKEMLSNEEAVSDVATALMYADWRFDPDREGKEGHKKTLYSYRNQCAIWAIKTYVTQKYKNNNKAYKIHSLDKSISDSQNEMNGYNITCDYSEKNPLDILIENEKNKNISADIFETLNSGIISEKQKDQLMMYYFESMTLSQIGKHFGVSREAVRQNIKRAIQLIKNYDQSTDNTLCNSIG